MLGDVIAIVGRKDEIGIVKDTIISKSINEPFNKFINCLKSLKTSPVKFIIICDYFIRELI